jgi:hypothetical protein
MTEPDVPTDSGSDTDAVDATADYDPDADQDTETSNMAPAGDRPNDPPAASSS